MKMYFDLISFGYTQGTWFVNVANLFLSSTGKDYALIKIDVKVMVTDWDFLFLKNLIKR